MDDFKKAYEYEEDRIPGLTLTFILMLLGFEIPCAILACIQAVRVSPDIKILHTIIIGVFIVYGCYIIFTDICLFKVTKNAIRFAKIYLAVRVILLLPGDIAYFIFKYNDPAAVGKNPGQYRTKGQLTNSLLVFPIMYLLLFTVFWFLYFNKSKKVKHTYGQ